MEIRIIPDINIENTNVTAFFTNIYRYESLASRIQLKELKLKPFIQYTYEILFTKEDTSFYFIFPDKDKELILNELNICWPKATFKEMKRPSIDITDCVEFELEKHFFLSLKVDKRSLFPLPSWLESSRLLREDEKVLIQMILAPEEPSWYKEAEEAIKNFKQGYLKERLTFNKEKLLKLGAKVAYNVVFEALSTMSEFITGEPMEEEKLDTMEYEQLFRQGLSANTQKKPSYLGYDVSLRIAVQCVEDRKEFLMRLFKRPVNELKEDNSLIIRPLKFEALRREIYRRKIISKWNDDILSAWELGQLIQMPTKAYQQMYHINSIDTREVEIPKELFTGYITIGKTTYKGLKRSVYWNENYNVLSLPKVIVGPMGAGKSEYATRYAVEAGNHGDAVVVFDYIKNCEMSEKVKKHTKAKVYEINLADLSCPFALAFNEVQILPDDTKWQKLEKANRLAEQTRYLIDSLTTDVTQPLTSKMQRYLNAACMVTYINSNEKIETVLNVLMNHKIRHKYIDKALQSGIFTEDDIEIQDLLNLDEHDKEGNIVDTKESKIEGIIDRFNILMRNIYLKQMIKADPADNPHFEKLFDEGYTILIRIPESTFSNKQVKDTIVTFFMSKIWLTELIRGGKQEKPKIVHVITDEVHQIPTAAKLISDVIDEARKFGCSFFFTVHYLKQFRHLLDSVKSAGVSYMLLGGTEKENYLALKEELGEFTIEEAMTTKPFHSLNITNYGNTRAIFDTELPRPL